MDSTLVGIILVILVLVVATTLEILYWRGAFKETVKFFKERRKQ